jgi:hypothetical protein
MSPDGKSVVYVARGVAATRTWLRRLDQLDASAARRRKWHRALHLGRQRVVGFVDQSDPSSLKKVSILGGPALLAKAKDTVIGVAWTHDHAIVMGVSGNGLHSVADSGGDVVPLTTLDAAANESDHVWPAEVPGTPVILFVTSSRSLSIAGSAQLAAVDRASGRVVRFKLPGSHPRFVAPDHMVYAAADGALRAVTFDPKTMTISGNPVPVVEGVGIKTSGASNFDVSRDGRLVYCAVGNSFTAARTIAWADRSGKETAIPAPARTIYVRISDNTHLSLDVWDEDQDIWTGPEAQAPTRLTDRPGASIRARRPPRPTKQFGRRQRDGPVFDPPDGTGTVEQLTDMAKGQARRPETPLRPTASRSCFAPVHRRPRTICSSFHDRHRIITKVPRPSTTASPRSRPTASGWRAIDLSGHAEVSGRSERDAAQYPCRPPVPETTLGEERH